jgi:7-cyano-7-deazaguanine synthase in queuosine biosynthesis
MIEPRLFLCSGIKIEPGNQIIGGRKIIDLDSLGSKPNVHIKLENVTDFFLTHLTDRLVDLLEIATYVFAADCSTKRGTEWSVEETVEPWGRDFKFLIPVRDLQFWQSEDIQKQLVGVLNFLSNDDYSFEFTKLKEDRQKQNYLDIGETKWDFEGVDRVSMFSGGLDSLAGAVQAANDNKKLVLVSHRPVAYLGKRQQELFAKLKETFPVPMIHIPVWINKAENFSREHTQRTRSFLFSALGTIVAEMLNAGGVSFFENGVVSLNLPVADEVLQARASRTTHPITLALFSQFYSLVTERQFIIDNPYLFKTKSEIIEIIANNRGAKLIQYTCSCAHNMFKAKTQWHCGTCSQCIDRRIAVLAVGQESNDPDTDYVSDVFTGPRKERYEKNMAVNFARHGVELNNFSENELATKFNRELIQATRYLEDSTRAAQQLIALHKRHGSMVKKVLDEQLQKNVSALLDGNLEKTCMLAMIAGQEHIVSSWKQYADRIYQVLQKGIPVACEKHKALDEPHLQQLCDAILKSNDVELDREFPFMQWSSSLTKPDGSVESLKLWIEYKYVRDKKGIRPITEDISADLNKYGDNDRNVAFIIYDPKHLITDDKKFSEPIVRRQGMLVYFIR